MPLSVEVGLQLKDRGRFFVLEQKTIGTEATAAGWQVSHPAAEFSSHIAIKRQTRTEILSFRGAERHGNPFPIAFPYGRDACKAGEREKQPNVIKLRKMSFR